MIGYVADGPWAHRSLDALLQNGRFEIAKRGYGARPGGVVRPADV